MKQLHKNLLAAYNEAIDNKRMTEETARTSIETKYGVVFSVWASDRFTVIADSPIINTILNQDVKTFPRNIETDIDVSNNPHGKYELSISHGDTWLGSYYYDNKEEAQNDESEVLYLLND